MQSSTIHVENHLNTIPEHLTSNPAPHTASDSDPATASLTTECPQNLSFSSAYTASRLGSSGTHFSLISDRSESNPITSFTVLNLDDLATTAYRAKPNAIVRPFRCPEQPGTLRRSESEASSLNQSRRQASESSAARYGRNLRMDAVDERSFAEELKRKLRFLHARTSPDSGTKSRISPKNANNQQSVNKRPRFITTVPTGIFLPPARESPSPTALRRRLYAYSSHPVVLDSSYNGSNNLYNNNPTLTHKNNKKNSQFSKDKPSNTAPPPIGVDDKECMTQMKKSTCTLSVRGVSVGGGGSEGGGVGGPGVNENRGTIRGSVAHDTHTPRGGVQNASQQQSSQQIQSLRGKREAPVEPYKNVMYDRRVIRGPMFGNAELLADNDSFDRASEIRRSKALRRIAQARNPRNVIGTPPPVKGRCHEVVQTEKYLEELFERPPECTVDTQTDLFLERPPTPPYIPAKIGVDVATEIGEGELFHFDAEAQPIIDILVDSCIEQSMLEVVHEQEIDALRKKQEEFLAQREAELAELRRLEAEEIRLQAEKVRRLRQDAIAKELDDEMQKGVTAAKLLQGHIASLLPEVLENLEPATDTVKKEKLMRTICPWLSAEVANEVGSIVDSREILTAIIQEIIKQRAAIYAGYKEDSASAGAREPPCYEDEDQGEAELECCTCHSEESEGCPPLPNEVETKKMTI